MKIEIKENKKISNKPFPKLMIGSLRSIILASRLENGQIVGTVIKNNDNIYPLGYYSENWNKSEFKDFEDEITLSND